MTPARRNSGRETRRRPKHRGIYFLPNLLTTAALFAGFYAVVASMAGAYSAAAAALVAAGILDGLDGRIARLTGTQSEFGLHYDSLSDLLSFGIAPALLVYNWSLVQLRDVSLLWGKLGWLAAFLYAACAALRLARFNSQAPVADKRYFQGLASPAAAAVIVGLVWSLDDLGIPGSRVMYPALAMTVLAAALMVSNIRYYSFKVMPARVPFVGILILLLFIALFAADPPRVLFLLAIIYLMSGPVMTILGRWRLRRRSARVAGRGGQAARVRSRAVKKRGRRKAGGGR